MITAWDELVPQAQAFLSELSRNNDRAWFAAHKARYETELKHPAQFFLSALQPDLEVLAGACLRSKLFRPQRDVRFSADKTPYHTHLHMLWEDPADGPSFFFGIAPGYVTAGAGWMAFEGPTLAAWRDGVGAPEGAPIQQLLRESRARLSEPELKRVPPPHDADHPRADLLRRKSLVLWRDEVDVGDGALPDRVRLAFEGLWPALREVRALLG